MKFEGKLFVHPPISFHSCSTRFDSVTKCCTCVQSIASTKIQSLVSCCYCQRWTMMMIMMMIVVHIVVDSAV